MNTTSVGMLLGKILIHNWLELYVLLYKYIYDGRFRIYVIFNMQSTQLPQLLLTY